MSEPGDTVLPLTASLDGPAGQPVLVLGNSLGTSRQVWQPQLPALAGRFRLLRWELPGHGRPGGPLAPAGPYSIDGLGAAVLALLDRYGIERAHYAGISLGGMAGMWLAAHAPDRIGALGLCCTSAHMPPASAWLERAALVRSAGLAPVAGPSLGRWFTAAFRRAAPGTVAACRATLEAVDPAGYAGCCEAIAAMDLRPALARIAAPTLVIAGSEDPSAPPPHAALLATRIPAARLTVVRGAAHLANVQAPGPVTAALLAHLTDSGR
jgi:3-oxoadipate enol-lactonase